jgi:hypothetical protein
MEECPICLTPLSGAITTVGCCKKQFHTGCILQCTQVKNECPMCRDKQCIVYVPEPEQTEVIVEYDQRRFLKSFLYITSGCFVLAISVTVFRSYL